MTTHSLPDEYFVEIEAHFAAAERYETAQLIAETGIVLASLAVLLASRPVWRLAVLLGLGCLIQLGRTYMQTGHVVRDALAHVQHAEASYDHLRKAHAGASEDEKIIERLDPDGKMRAGIKKRGK